MTTPTGSGVTTVYRGVTSRGGVEARLAALPGLVGWQWTYEPFDADGWIPDFLIAGDAPFLIEVGPCVSWSDYEAKAAKPLTYTSLPTVVLGALVVPAWDRLGGAGVMVNEFAPKVGFGPACWTATPGARVTAVSLYGDSDRHYPEGSWATRTITDGRFLEALWRRAGNEVQWRGPQRVGDILAGMVVR